MDIVVINFDHEAVVDVRKLTSDSPQQWIGKLSDGRHFYFRYRWGTATIGIGGTQGEAQNDELLRRNDRALKVSREFDLYFVDDQQRNEAFRTLLHMADSQ